MHRPDSEQASARFGDSVKRAEGWDYGCASLGGRTLGLRTRGYIGLRVAGAASNPRRALRTILPLSTSARAADDRRRAFTLGSGFGCSGLNSMLAFRLTGGIPTPAVRVTLSRLNLVTEALLLDDVASPRWRLASPSGTLFHPILRHRDSTLGYSSASASLYYSQYSGVEAVTRGCLIWTLCT